MNTKKTLCAAVGGMLIALGTTGLAAVSPSVPVAGATTYFGALPLEPASTVSQRNAVRAAQSYLDYKAFSRAGLIKQLEFEDYSTADATFAVDSITVDWDEQAAKSAKDYLDYTSFSRSGLIKQLEFEGFTPAQAAYGASAAGL
jgi:hypothetical protein